mmetsp:Transcript_14448/g.29544  ORF Transcript_14448/g.29544 Transcript_14448/m.29544 type:complete len:81 (-) Transcript_14448:2163-2405(-)
MIVEIGESRLEGGMAFGIGRQGWLNPWGRTDHHRVCMSVSDGPPRELSEAFRRMSGGLRRAILSGERRVRVRRVANEGIP